MDRHNALSKKKQALLELRLKGGARRPADVVRPGRRASGDDVPLSFAQFYIWASDRATPGNPSHNLPVGFRLRGPLNAAILEDSFNAVVRRHESLRTTFAVKNGEPYQVVHEEHLVRIALIDLSQLPLGAAETSLQKLASRESADPFDLSRLPLVRVTLYRLDDADHVLLVNLHHIVADGLSIGPLLQELDALYNAALSGSAHNLPALQLQYSDFAAWVRSRATGESNAGQVEYWRSQLSGRIRPL
jgi:hypothetical protein